MNRYLTIALAALTGSCVAATVKPEPVLTVKRISLEQMAQVHNDHDFINVGDSFTELCFHFGGEYCQPDCALLKAYLPKAYDKK